MNDNAIKAYIDSLSRADATYAAAFAHWLAELNDEAEATARAANRRVGIRASRAATIRKRVIAAAIGPDLAKLRTDFAASNRVED